MSFSTPVKRKHRRTLILSESEDDDNLPIASKSKTPKTEKFMRKKFNQDNDDDNEDNRIFYLVQFISSPDRFENV